MSALLWVEFRTKAMATLRELVLENNLGAISVTYLTTELHSVTIITRKPVKHV